MVSDAEDDGTRDDDLVWRWHDNLIYGIRFDIGDPEKQKWRSELVLDIDFIDEWLCEKSDKARFRVAPATLTFHDVADLRLSIDHGDSEGRTAMSELSIDSRAFGASNRVLALDDQLELASGWQDRVLCQWVFGNGAGRSPASKRATSTSRRALLRPLPAIKFSRRDLRDLFVDPCRQIGPKLLIGPTLRAISIIP